MGGHSFELTYVEEHANDFVDGCNDTFRYYCLERASQHRRIRISPFGATLIEPGVEHGSKRKRPSSLAPPRPALLRSPGQTRASTPATIYSSNCILQPGLSTSLLCQSLLCTVVRVRRRSRPQSSRLPWQLLWARHWALRLLRSRQWLRDPPLTQRRDRVRPTGHSLFSLTTNQQSAALPVVPQISMGGDRPLLSSSQQAVHLPDRRSSRRKLRCDV